MTLTTADTRNGYTPLTRARELAEWNGSKDGAKRSRYAASEQLAPNGHPHKEEHKMDFLPAYVYGSGDDHKVAAPKEQPEGTHKCDGCNGSGIYYGAGSVVNGKFVGFTGTCYRCGGKGHQTEADIKRNACYDRNRKFYF